MNTSETTSVLITELDWRGRGVVHAHGRVHRIPGVLPGERITLTGDEHPRLLRIDDESPSRRAVDCDQAGSCPGCQLRHGDTSFSMRWRSERVVRDFVGAGLAVPPWQVLGHAARDDYRVRAVAHALIGSDGRLTLGMRGDGRSVELSECPVQSKPCRDLIAKVEHDLRDAGITVYDPQTRLGELRHVVVDGPIDCGDDLSGHGAQYPRARVTLCFGRPIDLSGLANSVLKERPGVALAADILPYRSPGLFAKPVSLRGGLAMDMRIESDWFRATIPAWTPQTPETAPIVRDTIMDWLGPLGGTSILEVGCGVGTNSLTMARAAAHLVGVDSSREAIEDATYNAARGGVTNCTFRVGEAEKSLSRIWARYGEFDAVVLHAMRRPFGRRAISTIAKMRPARIIYLGPSARSIGEDLAGLREYEMTDLGGVDQSPGTTGMLTICALSRLPT